MRMTKTRACRTPTKPIALGTRVDVRKCIEKAKQENDRIGRWSKREGVGQYTLYLGPDLSVTTHYVERGGVRYVIFKIVDESVELKECHPDLEDVSLDENRTWLMERIDDLIGRVDRIKRLQKKEQHLLLEQLEMQQSEF